eukprot:399328-Hanusia_phi.AAC.1
MTGDFVSVGIPCQRCKEAGQHTLWTNNDFSVSQQSVFDLSFQLRRHQHACIASLPVLHVLVLATTRTLRSVCVFGGEEEDIVSPVCLCQSAKHAACCSPTVFPSPRSIATSANARISSSESCGRQRLLELGRLVQGTSWTKTRREKRRSRKALPLIDGGNASLQEDKGRTGG